MKLDLILRNCRLDGRNNLVDLAVDSGKIRYIESKINGSAEREIDVAGNLISSPFIDPHLHLDAVVSRGEPAYNESGTLLEGIRIWGERKKNLAIETIKKNAREAIEWEVANGVLEIRTHADTSEPSLVTVKALVELREELKDLVNIQVVAFPQDGIYTHKDGEKLMREAIDIGADVVGGIPHNEFTREDGVKDVEFAFKLACDKDLPIDIHVDETGDDQSRFIEVMAKEAIVRGMQGRVAASHTTAMHNYNNDYAFKLIGILKRADMNIITNPFDNAVLQNRTDGYPRKRGHTRVDELCQRDVNVCIGHDSIMDPWYPMGKGSMLQAANLLMHTAHLTSRKQIDSLFDMITVNSARTMQLNDYGIEVGNSANLIVLDSESRFDAIRLDSECLFVIRKGEFLVETTPAQRNLHFEEETHSIDFKTKR